METLTRFVVGATLTAVVVFCGCSNPKSEGEMQKAADPGVRELESHFVKVKVTRYYQTPEGVPRQESKEITDSKEIKRLASFFPELGKKETKEPAYGSGGWKKEADIRFFRENGEALDVTVDDPALDTYACTNGKGDYAVRKPKEFQAYFRKLFKDRHAPDDAQKKSTREKVGKVKMEIQNAELQIVLGDLANRKKRIDDKKEIQRLLSFFPELGSGKQSSEVNPWKHAVILRFTKADGSVVKVTTNHDLFKGSRATDIYFWSEGKGDWPLKNPDDFRTFIRKLFKEKDKPGSGDSE